MFSLENELHKREQILADKDTLIEKKADLEAKLNEVNDLLNSYDYAEVKNEINEIMNLMGIKFEEETEDATTENAEEGQV